MEEVVRIEGGSTAIACAAHRIPVAPARGMSPVAAKCHRARSLLLHGAPIARDTHSQPPNSPEP